MKYLILLIALLGCASPASDVTDRPDAVQRLPAEYQKAFDLLPNGPWAKAHYKEVFDDYDPNQWAAMQRVYETRVCATLMWDLAGSDDFEGLIDFKNSKCDLDKVLAAIQASSHEPPSESQFEAWVKADKPEANTADKINAELK